MWHPGLATDPVYREGLWLRSHAVLGAGGLRSPPRQLAKWLAVSPPRAWTAQATCCDGEHSTADFALWRLHVAPGGRGAEIPTSTSSANELLPRRAPHPCGLEVTCP